MGRLEDLTRFGGTQFEIATGWVIECITRFTHLAKVHGVPDEIVSRALSSNYFIDPGSRRQVFKKHRHE